ncbi:molybdenum cofactor biosynthesis protein MoaE [Sphingorhabdus sp. Alg239-R122]|uniref:molybdenum cofactor biosynthesis protein MoaE n=1 Tax=Sphingorhabdus sp. Alg239-R122 TaxID=2305989 RepID=UPI0013D96590|nr:molybdenum cofactor biosynthesis protein MoaE [Sphingorhabdus sp. Alg239-R122]
MITLSAEAFDPYRLLREFTEGVDGVGAVASFTGLVRGEGDVGVSALILEHHSTLTRGAIEEAVQKARRQWDLLDLRIVHRIGRVEVGEPIVLVATAAKHRRDAFESCDMLMDFLKTDVPFWKKEFSQQGERWVEPGAKDHHDRSRWS